LHPNQETSSPHEATTTTATTTKDNNKHQQQQQQRQHQQLQRHDCSSPCMHIQWLHLQHASQHTVQRQRAAAAAPARTAARKQWLPQETCPATLALLLLLLWLIVQRVFHLDQHTMQLLAHLHTSTGKPHSRRSAGTSWYTNRRQHQNAPKSLGGCPECANISSQGVCESNKCCLGTSPLHAFDKLLY
jgi:hypothetical protein